MVTEIVQTANLDFDKEDIAAIAIAEAEIKMRETVKTIRKHIVDIENAINETEDRIHILGNDAITKKTATTLKNIKAGLKTTKIKTISAELNISVNVVSTTDVPINHYSIRIILKNKDRLISEMIIERDSFPAIQSQLTEMKKLHELENQKATLTSEAMDWRRKLSDMPMLERQIKAKLARHQIEKTVEGRAMINELIKNFDQTVKLLGQ